MPATRIIRSALLCVVALTGVACASQRSNTPVGVSPLPFPSGAGTSLPNDPSAVYHQMGLIATNTPISYVGKIAYFATASPDSTMMLVSISIPNRALSFIRDGETYRAPYEVRVRLTKGGTEVKSVNTMEVVRVATFKEVNRTDESVIFQHYFRIPPSDYNISFVVRDVASNRNSAQDGAVTVPRMTGGRLSTPLLAYEAVPRLALDSLPKILASPRSSAVFGRDSSVTVYLEGYGQQARLPVSYVVQNDRGVATFRDTTVLLRHGNLLSGAVKIPISRVGIGIANITFTRSDATDTVRTPVFVSFGSDIPLLSFEDLLSQLRYYAAPDRIRSLRDTPVDRRGAAWAEFIRSSDPAPATPEHEGLQTYFARLQLAAVRFREDGPARTGFLADRSKVFVSLGEPDQLYEQTTNTPLSRTSVTQRGRLQYWEYTQHRVRLVFYDETGIGRWRLTPSSETEFQNLNARLLVR